jgi:uncharacterized protein with HEPN domain
MRREKGDPAFLYDMLLAAKAAMQFAAGKTFEQFQQDELLRSAIERKIEIVGEAARSVSHGLMDSTPQIPWRQITATRHILAHDYDIVNVPIIWKIVTVHLPELAELLEPLIPTPPADPQPET